MPTATKSITLPGNKPSLRVMFEYPLVCAAPMLREQNDFAMLSVISSQKTLLFNKFHDFHVPRMHHGETCLPLKLFAQPMDRAEVLHAPSYDISGSWKNTPGENELVLSFEIATVRPKFYT